VDTKNKSAGRGRPRQFDPDEAIAIAQRLFHEKGYDAVSVADLTRALGINPPSFYSAFGSKAALFARILDRYAVTGAIPLTRIFEADRPLADALKEVLLEAARHYAADATVTGCLVLEGTRCDDPEARDLARGYHVAAQDLIRQRIADRYPQEADRLADFVCTTMAGMSASARHGQGLERLLATAQLAGTAIAAALPA
jgi:TetR/AcrR family transcriptional regulator, repressor for divergent bdcA